METENQNRNQNTNSDTNQFGSDSAKEKQKEFNENLTENLTNQSDTQLNDSASRLPSSKDVASDTGYKQNEAEEMSGEVTRKHREEDMEKGGDKGDKDVSINESGNIQDENTIVENTKERATLEHTTRSVV